jgi:hypothetical protein
MMQKISTHAALKIAIEDLQLRQEGDYIVLKEQLMDTYHSFSVGKIIKRAVTNAVSMPGLGNKVLSAAVGLTTGLVTKKLVIGTTSNPLLKLLGLAVEIAVADKVTENSGKLKTLGKILLNKVFKKRQKVEQV